MRAVSVLLALALASAVGCRQDMHNQPKFVSQRGTTFFADNRSARPQVVGTIARSEPDQTTYFDTGLINGAEGDGMPLPVTAALLARGQERYNIFCSPCHSRTGYGHGMIVQRGYYAAANLQTERLRTAPLGHFFGVITNGYGAMPDYAAQLAPSDRWAVVAYIRALQLSQSATRDDAPPRTSVVALARIASQQGYPSQFADTSFWHERPAPRPAAALAAGTAPSPPPRVPAKPARSAPAPSSPIAPGTSASATEPPRDQPAPHTGSVSAGKQVYESDCAMCHQSNLGGNPPAIPALIGVIAHVGEQHVREVVTNGVPDARPMMPAFGDRLSASQLNDLLAYLKTVVSPQ